MFCEIRAFAASAVLVGMVTGGISELVATAWTCRGGAAVRASAEVGRVAVAFC